MSIWIPIIAAVVFGLVGTVWFTVQRRMDKHGKEIDELKVSDNSQNVELARGGERFDYIKTQLRDIQTDIKEVKKNCPKCPG